MNKTTYYFIRHAQVYNPKQILYGRKPRFKLSDAGRRKVLQIAQQMKKEQISVIFASPMLRARQTAEIIGTVLNLKSHTSELLNEVRLFCEGVKVEHYHTHIQQYLYSDKNIKKGQESIESIGERMVRFVNRTHQKFPDKKIIAVSHGDPILILKTVTLGIKFTWEYKVSHYLHTGEWIKLVYDGKTYQYE